MIGFLIVGAIGIALLAFSLILGDILDGLFDFGGDLFSGMALAGFLGAFGFSGALAYDTTGSMTLAMVIGLVAGVVIGAGAGWVSYKLKQGGDESNVRTGDLTWAEGTVVSAIPEDGYGEISVVVSGHITKLNARSSEAVPSGTPITITAILSATSVLVEPRI